MSDRYSQTRENRLDSSEKNADVLNRVVGAMLIPVAVPVAVFSNIMYSGLKLVDNLTEARNTFADEYAYAFNRKGKSMFESSVSAFYSAINGLFPNLSRNYRKYTEEIINKSQEQNLQNIISFHNDSLRN